MEWSQCQPIYCDSSAPEYNFCPCTCNPGTVNSDPEHFTSNFGGNDAATAGEENTSGTGGAGDAAVDETAGQAAPDLSSLSWSVMRTGYICEEQDFELMHFRLGMMFTVRQCAETVAQTPFCSPVFFAGPRSGTCGCVKQGFECAENEANDLQADSSIMILGGGMGGMGGPMAPSANNNAGNMMPADFNPYQGPSNNFMLHPEFEAPEAEDFLPGLVQMMGGMGGGGVNPYSFVSKTAPQQAKESPSTSSTPSKLSMALCILIPGVIGFGAGLALWRYKFQPNSDLAQPMTV